MPVRLYVWVPYEFVPVHCILSRDVAVRRRRSLDVCVRLFLEAGFFIRTTQHAREGLCSEDFPEDHSSRIENVNEADE